MTRKLKKNNREDTINGYVYVEKYHNSKIIYGI